MRIGVLPLLVLVLVLLAGLALAEPPQVPPNDVTELRGIFKAFFDLSLWLKSISGDVDKLKGSVSGLVLALVMLGFVYSIVQGIAGGGLEAIKGAFVRLAVVGLLLSLSNSGFVGNTLDGAMEAAREWSTGSATDTLSQAAENLDTLALRVVPFMGAVGAVKVISSTATKEAIKNETKTVASGMASGSTKILQYLNWTALLLIPMLLFFFIIIVVASFTVKVGVGLFPLAAALLIFPRGAAVDWFGRWVAMVMGALLLVILLPIGFKASVDMGINRPVYQVNAYVDAGMEAVESQKEANLQDLSEKLPDCGINMECRLENFVSQKWTEVKSVAKKIGIAVLAWFMGVIFLVMGTAAGAYILFNVERVALGFIGGFVASGVRQMLGRAEGIGGQVVPGGPLPNGSGGGG
ncbi:MAG: hypothetical protein C4331_18455, partial [Meiothermus sp.]